MKKNIVALAVLGAVAGMAQAQSSVVIYGTVDAGVTKRSDTSMAIGKRANNVLGFKGTEDLGSGLKALFQIETRFEPDTGTIEGTSGTNSRPLFQGQSRVGLQGDFGMIRFGRGLTALQETSQSFDVFHGLSFAGGFQVDLQTANFDSDPLGTPGNSRNRIANAFFYNSPEFAGGWQLNASVGTKENNGNSAVNQIVGRGTLAAPQYGPGAEGTMNPYSVALTYKNGPAAFMGAYERNAVESKLFSVAATVMATSELKLFASFQGQTQEHTVAANNKTRSFVVGANYTVGAGKFMAGFGERSTDGQSKVKQTSVGYEYSLSKRTYVYADLTDKRGLTGAVTKWRYYDLGISHSF